MAHMPVTKFAGGTHYSVNVSPARRLRLPGLLFFPAGGPTAPFKKGPMGGVGGSRTAGR